MKENPISTLLKVKRDGNPLREHGHVSPLIGKLGPLDPEALDRFVAIASPRLPRPRGPVLVIGLTESSLVLAWWLAKRLPEATLAFSSREGAGRPSARSFKEPHSHAPDHSLIIPPRRFGEVVIVEDEITTGTTLKNLILSLGDLCDHFVILTLSDLREGENAGLLEKDEKGLFVSVIDLSLSGEAKENDFDLRAPSEAKKTPFNPFGRSESTFLSVLGGLRRIEDLGCIYAIGECLDLPLAFHDEKAVPIHHVTRSPWLVDGEAILGRLELEGNPRHFLYNWQKPNPPVAAIVGNESTADIAEALRCFLASNGIQTHVLNAS